METHLDPFTDHGERSTPQKSLAEIEAEYVEWWNSLTPEEREEAERVDEESASRALDGWIESSRRRGIFV